MRKHIGNRDTPLSVPTLWIILTGVMAVSAVLLIIMGILVTMFFSRMVDSFIYKQLQLREGTETYEMWKKPPVEPRMSVYLFNLTNPREFSRGEKPKFREIGPYVYNERWEKIVIGFNDNGTVTYHPTKQFFFNEALSTGSEDDIIQTLNIPLMSAVAQMKYAASFTRLATGSLFGVLNQETFVQKTIKELLWGYEDSLMKLAKDMMPPDRVLPHNKFGFFVGKNESLETGEFTVFTGQDSPKTYGIIDNWNGINRMDFWKTEECNSIKGTDGTAFPPGLTPETVLHLYQPDLCRSLPLVYKKDVVRSGVEGFRFTPPINVFDTREQNPDNDCYCMVDEGQSCGRQGLFNISACKFGAPMAISWPHFLHGDPTLLEALEGLNPNPNLHEFYIDFQPKLSIAMAAKARLQINFMISKVEDIKQVAGIPEMVFPLFWFESGIDVLPEPVVEKLRMVATLPETARAGISYSMFGLGGILLLVVALMIWKKMRSKAYGSGGRDADVEFEKRADTVSAKAPRL